MTERVTRSKTGKTPSKPSNPGFVETPSRRKSTRKSLFANVDGASDSSPDPTIRLGTPDLKTEQGFADLNGELHNGNALNGHANGKVANGHVKSEPVITDPTKDTTGRFEFGGSFGVSAIMLGFPALMYYMWIGAVFYDGKFPTPVGDESFPEFLQHMVYLVRTQAFPHSQAWAMYWVFMIMQMTFYMLLPGVVRQGKPLLHLGGKQLDYYCSAVYSFYTTIVLALGLHFTGIFSLYTLIDQFGPIMSVAIISGFLCSFLAYTSALLRGAQTRMTGYPIYDFFMGAELNPRLFGILDFKMFLEVRIPWFILFLLTLSTATRQYENYGYVSGEVCFQLFAHFLYANACAKGEHLIITTWDMYYEKLGFMLIFWNLAGVPLSYCHSTLYLASHDPEVYRMPRPLLILMTALYVLAYYVWDTTNSQKNMFRQEERSKDGTVDERKTFPYFRYGRIKNPKKIPTKTGDSILCDGWYGKARKIHYTCDLFFALSWGFVTGFHSPFPWFYSAFFSVMIVHRAMRDIERCRERYGEAWEEYTRRVPYLFIPYVF